MNPCHSVAAYINIFVVKIKHWVSCALIPLKSSTTARCESHKAPAALIAIGLLFSFLYPSGCMATEVIVIVLKDGILFAADSLELSRGGSVEGSVCKIRQTGAVWWAVAGIAKDTDTSFYPATFFTAAINDRLNTRQILNRVSLKIKAPLQKEIPVIKKQFPDYYKRGSGMTLFAARMRGTLVDGSMKDLNIVGDKIVPGTTKTYFSTRQKPTVGGMFYVKIPEIDRYIETHPELHVIGPLDIIDRLMGVAITAHPDLVAPPVSILRITKDGPQWLRQNNCPNIQK